MVLRGGGGNSELIDFARKRQHVSTIDTSSPSRSLLASTGGAYPGYCTLRNGLPLQELNNIGAKPKMVNLISLLIKIFFFFENILFHVRWTLINIACSLVRMREIIDSSPIYVIYMFCPKPPD